MRRSTSLSWSILPLLHGACGPAVGSAEAGSGDHGASGDGTGGAVSSAGPGSGGPATTSASSGPTDEGDDGAADDGPRFDVPGPDHGGSVGCGSECSLDAVVCAAQPPFDPSIVHCGSVVLEDDASAWQLAHDCFAAVSSMGSSVIVRWQERASEMQIDDHALLSLGAPEPTITAWAQRADEVWASSCSTVTVLDPNTCTIGAGQICLLCSDAPEPVLVCEDVCKTCPSG